MSRESETSLCFSFLYSLFLLTLVERSSCHLGWHRRRNWQNFIILERLKETIKNLAIDKLYTVPGAGALWVTYHSHSLPFLSPISPFFFPLTLRQSPCGLFTPDLSTLRSTVRTDILLISTCTNNVGSFRHNTLLINTERIYRSEVDTPWLSIIYRFPHPLLWYRPGTFLFRIFTLPYFVLLPFVIIIPGDVGVLSVPKDEVYHSGYLSIMV